MKNCRIAVAVALVAGAVAGCTPVGALVGGSVVVARSVVQERSMMDALTDVEIEMSIATRLAQHSGALYRDVSVDVVEGRALLTGSVPRREDRSAASDIAWRTAGVTEVANELTVGEDSGARAYLADAGISNRLRLELLRNVDVKSANYGVETVDRVVHLTGIARSERELRNAIRIAQGIEGVERVVSHVLLIDDPRRRSPAEIRAAALPPG